ncbi:HAD domain-containing protein [Sphingobacterium sp.]|uniref:HAD domain-containing protein n=1 Tax=Sphingobacterium sp. TaxID=341027 RepID=UPI003918064D
MTSTVSRKTEIIDWINRHKLKPEEVLIIDDDKSLNDLPLNSKERLVLTNPYVGLNNQNELKSVLKRKVKKTVSG